MLSVGEVQYRPDGWVDEQVSRRSALLEFPRGGGTARAQFGVLFTGTVAADGGVDLAAKTNFNRWGCAWQSEQRIFGWISNGALTYTYREKPSHCANPRDPHVVSVPADAEVRVLRTAAGITTIPPPQ